MSAWQYPIPIGLTFQRRQLGAKHRQAGKQREKAIDTCASMASMVPGAAHRSAQLLASGCWLLWLLTVCTRHDNFHSLTGTTPISGHLCVAQGLSLVYT